MKKFYQFCGFCKRNLPTFLAIGASVGVIVTAIASGKAAVKAGQLKDEAAEIKGCELTRRESVIAQAPAYILPVVSSALTIGFIFGCNYLNRKQQASLAAAAMAIQKSYTAYRNKTIEKFGNEIDTVVKSALAEESYIDQNEKIPTPTEGNVLCYHPIVNQWVCCNPRSISEGEYDFNQRLSYFTSISLADYCNIFGLDAKAGYIKMGWSSEFLLTIGDYAWVEFKESECVTEAGTPYIMVEPEIIPMVNFEEWCYGDEPVFYREDMQIHDYGRERQIA